MSYYELWHKETGNLIADFPTWSDAQDYIDDMVEVNDESIREELVILEQDDEG